MEKLTDKEKNIRLYPLYKTFAWDLFFYYAIAFLFLTQVKKLTPADVLLTEAAYPIFKILLLVPLTAFIEKRGKRKSLILANISITLSVLILIFAQNIRYVFISQFFSALGYMIKGICETNMLYDSLPRNSKRGGLFARIDGRATGYYYYINAITSFAAGFLYIINPYIPMILCASMCIIATVICFRFREIDDDNVVDNKKYIKNTKDSYRSILKSPRLRNLIFFGAMVYGLLAILVTLRNSLLKDVGLPEQYFGVIFAILEMISGITTRNQHKFHNRLKNRTLTVLSIPVTISYLVQYIVKGPFYILIKRYLNNFTTHKIRNKISSLYNLVENLLRCMIALIASILLRYINTANVFIIIGTVFTIILSALLINMKDKVGLKPEEYTEKDIEFLKLK